MTSPEKMISSLSKRSPVLLSSTSKRSSELLSSTSRRSPVTRKSNATRKALYLQFSDELLTMSQPARPSANKNWYIACSLFGKIPIKYDPREKAHAQAYPYQRQIRIGPTFFTIRTLEDKILVLGHEVGHFFATLIVLKNKTPSYLETLENSGIFGHKTGNDFDGIDGLTSLIESIAQGFGTYVSPEYQHFLKEDYPKAYEFIDKYFAK